MVFGKRIDWYQYTPCAYITERENGTVQGRLKNCKNLQFSPNELFGRSRYYKHKDINGCCKDAAKG